MAKKEAQTDIWVYELLKSAHVDLCYQSSDVPEIEKALKTASKAESGKVGIRGEKRNVYLGDATNMMVSV